jgi:hypothetical protein
VFWESRRLGKGERAGVSFALAGPIKVGTTLQAAVPIAFPYPYGESGVTHRLRGGTARRRRTCRRRGRGPSSAATASLLHHGWHLLLLLRLP